MSDAAGEAGGAADQSSDRRRREKERKRKYPARKSGPVEAESARIASQQMKRAKIYRKYQSKEHVKERRGDNQRNTCHSTKTAHQACPVDVSAKVASQQMKQSTKTAQQAGPVETESASIVSQKIRRAKIVRKYQLKEHVKVRDADNKRNTRQSTKIAQQAGPVDVGVKIVSHQMKRAKINRKYKSKEHVKERDVDNKRNTCHSTKTAQWAPILLSYAPTWRVRMKSLTASSNGWNFGGGSAPKAMHLCDCNH